jgi:hypothetical protein
MQALGDAMDEWPVVDVMKLDDDGNLHLILMKPGAKKTFEEFGFMASARPKTFTYDQTKELAEKAYLEAYEAYREQDFLHPDKDFENWWDEQGIPKL